MGFSFSLSGLSQNVVNQVLQDSAFSELRVIFEHESQEHFLLAHPQRSTRGFELHYEHNRWIISLRFLAAPIDWLWAIRFVKALSKVHHEATQPSEQQKVTLISELDASREDILVSDLESYCSPEWLQHRVLEGVSQFLELVDQKEDCVPLVCWAGVVYFGKEILDVLELGTDTPAAEAFVVLIDYLSSLQKVLDQDFYQPKVQKVEDFAGMAPGEDSEGVVSEVHLAILPENLSLIVNTLNYEALGLWPETLEEPIWFPISRLAELFAAYLSPLDQVQYLIKPIPLEALNMVIAGLKGIYASTELPDDYKSVQRFFSQT